MGSMIMKPGKLKGMDKKKPSFLKGIEKMGAMPMDMGAMSAEDMGELKGAKKVKESSVPKAAKSEDMLKLDGFIKANKVKSKELDPEESVHNAEEEAEEGYSLDEAGKKYSKESPKVKKAYEEWIKSKKHLKMMGE